jgi:hypothetical protein
LLMTLEAAEVAGEDMKRCFSWVQGYAFFVEFLRSMKLLIGSHAYSCAYRICVLCLLEARVS